jgi:hypothetical protein
MNPSLSLIACLALLASCRTVPIEETRPAQPERKVAVFDAHAKEAHARTWTRRFAEGAILIADRIELDGPSDLLEHVAVRQDSQVFEFTTRTTREGLRQEMRRKAEAVSGTEIRAQLDGWTLVALQEMLVLQRPGDAPVRVVATGEAAWIPTGDAPSGSEQRAPRLEFQGEHGR